MKNEPYSITRLLKRCLFLTVFVALIGFLTLPSSHAAAWSLSALHYQHQVEVR